MQQQRRRCRGGFFLTATSPLHFPSTVMSRARYAPSALHSDIAASQKTMQLALRRCCCRVVRRHSWAHCNAQTSSHTRPTTKETIPSASADVRHELCRACFVDCKCAAAAADVPFDMEELRLLLKQNCRGSRSPRTAAHAVHPIVVDQWENGRCASIASIRLRLRRCIPSFGTAVNWSGYGMTEPAGHCGYIMARLFFCPFSVLLLWSSNRPLAL